MVRTPTNTVSKTRDTVGGILTKDDGHCHQGCKLDTESGVQDTVCRFDAAPKCA
jgi:hypothetical protein